MKNHPFRLSAMKSVLVIVDIQGKLLEKIPAAQTLVTNVQFLLEAAALCDVPVLATEQYPKGLGPTVPSIADRLKAPCLTKTRFSCGGAAGFLDQLRSWKRPTVVVAGMETHVCVLQTVLELLENHFQVVVPVDATAARFPEDHQTALRRLELAGAIPTTVESIGFEWIGDSTHPQFKSFSQLVIDRGLKMHPE